MSSNKTTEIQVLEPLDDEASGQRIAPEGELRLGQWYWVLPGDTEEPRDAVADDVVDMGADLASDGHAKLQGSSLGRIEPPVEGAWLGCVVKIGSNFCELQRLTAHGSASRRIHLDEFWLHLKYEPHADLYLRQQVEHWQGRVRQLVNDLNRLSSNLGVATAIDAQPDARANGSGTELMVMSGQADPGVYKAALILAKNKKVPALHESIKTATKEMSLWLQASTLPALAAITPMHETIKAVDAQIYSLGLYAGLAEQAVQCCDGASAAATDRLHVMQRLLYMDEEALLNYTSGGMDFQSIGEFGDWLAKPQNRDRILPFPRTLVAMRVRRNVKDREWNGSLHHLRSLIRLRQEDSFTFLFVRNGDQVWRISCEMEFGELIFPDQAVYSADEPKMASGFASGSGGKLMSVREFDQLAEEERVAQQKADAWTAANPRAHPFKNPHDRFRDWRATDWHLVSSDYVYFDEVQKHIQDKMREFNRVAVIIQGLFDRSEVLQPHPPVKSWTAGGFDAAIKLVYDASNVLHYGEPPEFEAYRARCNESFAEGSVAVGQEMFWLLREGARESARLDRDYRNSHKEYRPKTFRPYGDPGPGLVAIVREWRPRAKSAVFEWERERMRPGPYDSSTIAMRMSTPAADLFNVSAYQPGDFKQFFRDPRSRAQYLRWAPLLLAAEDYHAGLLKVGKPSSDF